MGVVSSGTPLSPPRSRKVGRHLVLGAAVWVFFSGNTPGGFLEPGGKAEGPEGRLRGGAAQVCTGQA